MPTDKMLSRKENGIGWMIFNNPERHNAVSMEMWIGAQEIMADFAADPSVRVMIVTGAGSKAFVSGADISKFKDERQQSDAVEKYQVTTEKTYGMLGEMPIPTIAMIRGYCIGGGAALAVTCDIRVSTENARFAIPAAKLGLGYGASRMKTLVDLVGPSFAKEMLYTARQLDATEALRIGLVNRVVADDKLESTVAELARQIADNAPLTVKAAKLVINTLMKDESERDNAACDRAVRACFASEDYKEGQAAFLEKRKAQFRGV